MWTLVLSHVFPVMIWLFVLCLFSSPLLTFDLSDLETSLDSRCTTDSGDSAFIGRRYWFLASSSFFFFHHFSSPIILSHTGSKIANQAAGHKRNWLFFLSWYFFPNCYLNVLSSIFFYLVIYMNSPVNSHLNQSSLPSHTCLHSCVCQYSVFVFMSIALYVFISFWKFVSVCMYYSYFYSPDTSFVFAYSVCIYLKQSCMMLHFLKSA